LIKRSGVLVPLFSLHSMESTAIGDAEVLRLMVDWCVKTGNSVIQLLPLNEVGENFCPYESTSSFAIDPMYAAVGSRRVTGLSDMPRPPEEDIRRTNYAVKEQKIRILREIHAKRDKSLIHELEGFRGKNSWWIEDFALFKALKRHFGGKAWYLWPDEYRERHAGRIEIFRKENGAYIDFIIWLQYFLHRQLADAHAYAASRGVQLMGDMPAAMKRDSADVWAHREFFNMELVAGAPPDMFCSGGQRWGNPGMPTYNWEKIEDAGYSYIKEKLRYAGEFYDILRIDHIVGLFRIWSIPLEHPVENGGIGGFFDPSDENLWEERGRRILTIMKENTGMLLCGEDLGVIPDACTETMEALAIPGMDVQRWKRDWEGTGEFLSPQKYRRLAVSALSTHDTSNWISWWRHESTSEEREMFQKHLDISRAEISSNEELNEAALKFILKTRSLFSIQLIFDWLNLDGEILKGEGGKSRINKPGTVKSENWSVMLPMPLEELLSHAICKDIRRLVSESGRLAED